MVKKHPLYKLTVLILVVIICCINEAYSQFYYKDIISNKQALADRALLQERKIKTIEVRSFEGNGEESKGFFCEKKISNNYRKIETYTKAFVTGRSVLTSIYNDKGLLIKTTDSSELTVTNIQYQYTSNGLISSIFSDSRSSDDDFVTSLTEEHQYTYNEKGVPVSMLRIKNKKDSSTILFTADEKANLTDEIEQDPNGKHYYYYYDDKNRLTDIVEYNKIRAKLVPDFIFEYNHSGQLSQMVAVEEGASSDYFTWKYAYENDLRMSEKCYSKEKLLLGYFEYEYK